MKFLRIPNKYEQQRVSKWTSDKRFEEMSISYLEKKTKILKDLHCREVVIDMVRQKKGIDLICNIPLTMQHKTKGLTRSFVDVKSIAGMLPTFSFEIGGNVNSQQPGWFINDEYLTNYYLLVYHVLADDVSTGHYKSDKSLMTIDNVCYSKAILISKSKLKSYVLKTLGLKNRNIQDIVKTVRRLTKDKPPDIYRFMIKDGEVVEKRKDERSNIVITCSMQLKEQPINIVIKRHILEEIADHIWEVHDDTSTTIQS